MTRPTDYTPIIPGTDEDPQPDEEALRPIARPAHLPEGGVAFTLDHAGDVIAVPESDVRQFHPVSTDSERIARLESTVAVLWKAIAALEQKIGVR